VAAQQANFMVERAMHQQELANVRAEVEKLNRIRSAQ